MALRQHKLVYQSSPDRGLDILLEMWPEIKKVYPDAELHFAYGWGVFDQVCAGNPERMAWKEKVMELVKQEGVFDHGKLGKEELKKMREKCGIWPYCTKFTEINCISALECQADGCVPVTMDFAALKETVQSGVKIKGDIYEKHDEYLKELLAMMGDEKRWKEEQEKGKKFASKFSWSQQVYKWTDEFKKKDEDILVSIVSPTIRRGFWNIMANNLAMQSYKNFEWIIVDDYPEDRSAVAKEYAKKYHLNIRYLRGKERNVKRTYGLINANNTGWQASKGQLVTILQDFILIPQDGIEQLVQAHKHHPNSLIAPVDVYFSPKIKPDMTKEDWFNGELDVIGKFIRQNARIMNLGFRESENSYEFEQNYGAIPKKIIDDLGGWYEFLDEGLGYDNTEFAWRALQKGYKLFVDETNCAVCIDHFETLKGTKEHGLGRERRLNDPRYLFIIDACKNGFLPLKRSQETDDNIELLYTMPDSVKIGTEKEWIRANADLICADWLEKYGYVPT